MLKDRVQEGFLLMGEACRAAGEAGANQFGEADVKACWAVKGEFAPPPRGNPHFFPVYALD
jgi:hypothetical protein